MFSSMRFLCIHFYPRPPRGGRPTISSASSAPRNFYPRPPRGGRLDDFSFKGNPINFYPRPPRGGRQGFYCTAVVLYAISIHALREEGD